MKFKSLFAVAAAVIFLTACSSTIKVTTDYDKSVDFTKYKSFAIYKLKVTDNVSQLNQERIINAVKNELIKKGFTHNDSNPDMYVNTTAILQDKQSVSANTYGYGGYYRPYGYGGGMGTTTYSVYEYKNGSLIIDIIDATKDKLIWEGTGNKDIDAPSKNPDVDIANAIAKILYTFPPVKPKKD